MFFVDELDSFMYQTVGHMGIEKLAQAMELPLYRRTTTGLSSQKGKDYEPTEYDEVEDLYDLLKKVRVSWKKAFSARFCFIYGSFEGRDER